MKTIRFQLALLGNDETRNFIGFNPEFNEWRGQIPRQARNDEGRGLALLRAALFRAAPN